MDKVIWRAKLSWTEHKSLSKLINGSFAQNEFLKHDRIKRFDFFFQIAFC